MTTRARFTAPPDLAARGRKPVPTGLAAAFTNRRRPTTDADPDSGAGRADTLVTTLPRGNYYLSGVAGGEVQLWKTETPRIDPGNVSTGVAAGRAAAADVATNLSVNAALNAKFDKLYGRSGG
ncbi:MAG: hypothetical protein HIU82_12535 [Proteobacteria bacterium]|nr:hypothetical protein [Pseudomonadota bacterium]